MEYREIVLYKTLKEEMHPLIETIIKKCKQYDVNTYLLCSIMEFETSKHPKLFELNNPGNICTEESQFMIPIKFDSMELGIERYVRLLHLIISKNEIFDVKDLNKLLRPLEPEWTENVIEIYSEILSIHTL